jgi:hypothetical protein
MFESAENGGPPQDLHRQESYDRQDDEVVASQCWFDIAQVVEENNRRGQEFLDSVNNIDSAEELQAFFNDYCRDVIRNIASNSKASSVSSTEYTGSQIRLLQEVTQHIMPAVARTPEGRDDDSGSSLYAASQKLLGAVLNNLRAWHEFNTRLQSHHQALEDSIKQTQLHFDGIRESKRF